MPIAANPFVDLARWFNYAEALLWPTMGLVLAVAAFRRLGVVRRDFLLAAAVLLAFGGSDLFEAENGNKWWEPWWLFAWKAACVAAMAALIGRATLRQQRAKHPPT